MDIVSTENMETRRGPEEWFTGSVYMESGSVPPPGARIVRVFFEPGARTHWHTHPEGQVLHIVSGVGRVGTEGGNVVELRAGDVVWFAPGERHWHGAGPETYMVHLAINPALRSAGETEWLEPVTDEEYRS